MKQAGGTCYGVVCALAYPAVRCNHRFVKNEEGLAQAIRESHAVGGTSVLLVPVR